MLQGAHVALFGPFWPPPDGIHRTEVVLDDRISQSVTRRGDAQSRSGQSGYAESRSEISTPSLETAAVCDECQSGSAEGKKGHRPNLMRNERDSFALEEYPAARADKMRQRQHLAD